MSRSLQTLSILARPSIHFRPLTRSKHSLLRHNGEINVQQVRFTKPLAWRLKRLRIQVAIGTLVIYSAFHFLIGDDEEILAKAAAISKAEDEKRKKVNDGAQEDEVDEDEVEVPEVMPANALFIPLGRPRQIPRTYYKGNDPEWQSFIEFRQDHQRSAIIQQELVETIHSFYTGTASVQSKIGVGVPVKLGRVWLDIVIPPGPSPEYERDGLEITSNYVALTTRPVPALQVARLKSAIMPLPVAKSMWASCSTYYSLQLARLKQIFNVAPSSSDTGPQLPVGTITINQVHESSTSKESQNRAHMDEMADPKSDMSSTKGSAKSATSDSSKLFGALPPLPLPHSDIGTSIKEFKKAMAKNWQVPTITGERGTFVVTGDIELIGPRGSCVLGVVADYHPREAKYKNVRMGFKYIIPRRQRPMPNPKPKDSDS